jgi:hypothetical protein
MMMPVSGPRFDPDFSNTKQESQPFRCDIGRDFYRLFSTVKGVNSARLLGYGE